MLLNTSIDEHNIDPALFPLDLRKEASAIFPSSLPMYFC